MVPFTLRRSKENKMNPQILSPSFSFDITFLIPLHPSLIMEPHFSSNVDTSRPFSSVKEAVAIFGERLLVGEVYSPKPFSSDSEYYSPSPVIKREPSSPKEEDSLVDTVKKLEEELEKTKAEVKLMKERGSETEVAVATLNAELHKNMSKLAQAEAMEAGKAAGATKNVRFEIEREIEIEEDEGMNMRDKKGFNITRDSQTLANILSLGENDNLFGGNKKHRKRMKHKPIIPLLVDLFSSRRKASSISHNNPLYASPF